MRALICPQAYKGTLTAGAAAEAIGAGLEAAIPDARVDRAPMADGGDGTLAVIAAAQPHRWHERRVRGPLGGRHDARYLELGTPAGALAVIEMATAAGLLLVGACCDPLRATSFGVGELIGDALDRGITNLVVGVGGSATVDGAIGMAQALGYRFLDRRGAEVARGAGAGALAGVAAIDASGRHPALATARIRVAADVSNRLCGALGAARVYGPQKGLGEAEAHAIDGALGRFAATIERDLGRAVAALAGGGAGGGLGAGLAAFAAATIIAGAPWVIETIGLDDRLRNASLVVTGEGCFDGQTRHGKTVAAITTRAREHGLATTVIAGSLGDGWEASRDALGIATVIDASAIEAAAPAARLTEAARRAAPRLL